MNALFTVEELADIVDTLANIRAQLAELKASEETYKAALIAAEVQAVDGTLHRATVSETYKTATDWQAIARASIEPELLKEMAEDYTTHAEEPTFTVRITARKATA